MRIEINKVENGCIVYHYPETETWSPQIRIAKTASEAIKSF